MSKEPKPRTRRATAPSEAQVAEAIRRAVMANDLAPGQRLVEAELCEQLGASRRNVRSALLVLAHEGLVERIANRGARVRVVGLQEALDLAEVRLQVELLCVGRAAERITPEGVAELRAVAGRMRQAAGSNDIAGFAEATDALVRTYVRLAGQPVAAEMLDRLRDRSSRHTFRLLQRPGWAQVALPLRLDLVEAVCRGDPAAARAALAAHAERQKAGMIRLAEENPALLGRRPFAAQE